MDRLRKLWQGSNEPAYEPLDNDSVEEDDNEETPLPPPHTFSYIEYSIFLLLGVSMLWAWNMFLAAGPYFQHRFRTNQWMFNNFQAAEISVSCVTNLSSMLILTRMQAKASYPKRIIVSLCINMVIFALLALSTGFDVSAGGYFGFLMVMMFGTSLATGLCQNGIFAYVAGFGQPSYTQGIMTGQAVAGVLPCIAQIVSVLTLQASQDNGPPKEGAPPGAAPPVRSAAAMAYFLTATFIAVVTLLAFSYMLARNRRPQKTHDTSTADSTENADGKKPISLLYLFRKLFWLATSVFITFVVTMFFPIFTQRIVSVRPAQYQPPILQPACFIPLAFLLWNAGDLAGRLITAVPTLSLVKWPRLVFVLSVCRVVFLGLYQLCNIRGQGAVIPSDFFYLVIVQFLFGLSNGYLGSICMIGAADWVEPEERNVAGGFMGLCLVGGLTVGSLLSFFASGT